MNCLFPRDKRKTLQSLAGSFVSMESIIEINRQSSHFLIAVSRILTMNVRLVLNSILLDMVSCPVVHLTILMSFSLVFI
jgi:hypothetical protein